MFQRLAQNVQAQLDAERMNQEATKGRIEYTFDETNFGIWRTYNYPDGKQFAEFRSHMQIGSLPLVHYTKGKCPDTNRMMVARGFIACGRVAVGVFAVGQAAVGVFAIGQAAASLIFGLGQATCGAIAIGQLALGLVFGLGQFTTGFVAIGQFAVGMYAMGQIAFGVETLSTLGSTPGGEAFFKPVLRGFGMGGPN